MIVLRRGFARSGNGRHRNVREDVALDAERASVPCDLNETVISVIDGQFTAPILLEDNTAHHGERGGDGPCVKFTVHGGEQQTTFIEADKFNGDFPGWKRQPYFRACLHVGNGDVEAKFTVFEFNT